MLAMLCAKRTTKLSIFRESINRRIVRSWVVDDERDPELGTRTPNALSQPCPRNTNGQKRLRDVKVEHLEGTGNP
jgi:hypothetical protein